MVGRKGLLSGACRDGNECASEVRGWGGGADLLGTWNRLALDSKILAEPSIFEGIVYTVVPVPRSPSLPRPCSLVSLSRPGRRPDFPSNPVLLPVLLFQLCQEACCMRLRLA